MAATATARRQCPRLERRHLPSGGRHVPSAVFARIEGNRRGATQISDYARTNPALARGFEPGKSDRHGETVRYAVAALTGNRHCLWCRNS